MSPNGRIPAADDTRQRAPSILIVDDMPSTGFLLESMLSAEGYHGRVFQRAMMALQAAHEEPPHLILLDINMPEMNGYELCRQLKAAPLLKDIPVIFISALNETVDKVEAFRMGGVDYLTKPFQLEEVQARVETHLKIRTLQRRLTAQNETVKQQNLLLDEWNTNLKHRVMQQTVLVRTRLEEANRRKKSIQETSDLLLLMYVDLLNRSNRLLGNNNQIVVDLAESMMETLQLPSSQREEIKIAAFIHDIGLFIDSDHPLNRSTFPESDEHGNHSINGTELLAAGRRLREIRLILRHQHDEYDGSGFPDGLAGEKIPLGSRIIHLARFINTVHARQTGIKAADEMNSELAAVMGSKFDPALAAAARKAVTEVLHAVDPSQEP